MCPACMKALLPPALPCLPGSRRQAHRQASTKELRLNRGSPAATGFEECSLSALSIGDYPFLEATVTALMEELAGKKVALSLSSLRPKGLSAAVAENILKVRKTGFTLA